MSTPLDPPEPVDPPDLTPQPGASYSDKGFIPNGLNPNGDVVHEDWPPVPWDQANNFTTLEPCILTAGSPPDLFRVWVNQHMTLGDIGLRILRKRYNSFTAN